MAASRQDFEVIAKAVKDSRKSQWADTVHAVDDVAVHLAVALKKTNPRFDAERFLDACGVEDPKARSVVTG